MAYVERPDSDLSEEGLEQVDQTLPRIDFHAADRGRPRPGSSTLPAVYHTVRLWSDSYAFRSDFHFPNHVHTFCSDGNWSFGPDPTQLDTVHRISHVSLLSPTVLAVQVEVRTRPPGTAAGISELHYRIYLLDPDDGKPLGTFSARHGIIGGGRGKAILYRSAPHPQFAVVNLWE